MITLITAPPGYGKTAHIVWSFIKPACDEGRTVYSSGIPKLKLPVTPLTNAEIKKWHVTTPKNDPDDPDEIVQLVNIDEGSMIVIDEAQRIWRPLGSNVSDDIAGLETHRHHGLDFVIATQHPGLLHRNVRALVGRHIHIRKTFLGRYSYEWPEWVEHPETKSARATAIRKRYKLEKRAFPLYESASVHVKTKTGFPIQLPIMAAALCFALFGTWNVYQRVWGEKEIEVITTAQATQKRLTTPSLDQQPAQPQSNLTSNFTSTPPIRQSLQVVSDQYDWSKIAACVVMRGECRCYGDQAERLVIPDTACRAAVSNGWSGRPAPSAPATTTTKEEAKSV